MRFKDIQGNETLIAALVSMVDSGKIPHAILFHENDGGGGIPIALALIQYLYCPHRRDGDACGECPACNRTSKLIHPDVHFVYPVAGSKSSSDRPTSETYVREWRRLVAENPYFYENELYTALGIESKSSAVAVAEAKAVLDKLSLSSVEGGYRTVVLYLPEKMNAAAANTLLKMIEEPPENTLFLLITHSPEKVLPTVASRCLPMRIRPLSREALRAVHPEQNAEAREQMDRFADLMNAVLTKNFLAALESGEALAALESREKQKGFCKFAAEAVRNLFLLQQGLPGMTDIPAENREFFDKTAAACRKTFPQAALNCIDRAQTLIERNVNQKIVFCDLVNRLYISA